MTRSARRAQWIARAHAAKSNLARPQLAVANTGPVAVHVETLVLHGFSASAGVGIGEAMQRELTHLIAQHGVPARMRAAGAAARVDAGSIAVRAGSAPATIGTQIASAVYGVSWP